jgi:hypothetical protein
MKKGFFLLVFFCSFFPQASFALTQIDVETEGNSIQWANTATTTENLGRALASGDVNGDGIDDILIGNSGYDCTIALGCSSDRADTGKVYLIYGSENTASSPFDNNTINSAVTFTGMDANDYAGAAISIIDINNDTFGDIFIGSTGHSSNGAIHLIYGQSSPLSSILLDDSSVQTFTGQSGVSVSGYVGGSPIAGGDINNDGYNDIVVTAPAHGTTGGLYGNGAVYIKYGRELPFGDGSFDSFDVKINGVEDGDLFGGSSFTGTALAVGDINNDSYEDIIIGASGIDIDGLADAGKTYILYGSGSLSSVINLSGTTDIEISGASRYQSPSSIITTDLNTDGYADIVIGIASDNTAGTNAGSIRIVYGQASTLSNSTITDHTIITGTDSYQLMGSGLAGGKDLNNDGKQDLVIGSPGFTPGSYSSQVHILFGSTSQETSGSINDKADILLQSLVQNHQNNFGSSFALGDFNGDGSPQFTDIAIGAPTTGPNKGVVYTFFQRFDNDDDGYDSPDADSVLFNGTDCDDTNIAIHTNYTFYQDEDNDNSGNGTTQVLCQGSSPSAPTGYRTSVLNTTDCNDSDVTISANQTYYQDADNDAIGSGATETICSMTPSSGYRVSVAGSNDCNDSDATVSANQTYYLDADADTIGSGTTTETICSMTPSSGYRTSVTGNNDCNDADAAISRNQTYYSDADGDGLGSDTSLTECSLTAPNGYVTNSNDTNDTVVNNGVEISGDKVDNDGDGTTDEVNTVSGNGAHPGYKNLSVTSSDDYRNAIQSVSARTNGKIRVTFKDGSIYDYRVFTTSTSKKTLYKIIKGTGRIVAVSENGKQIRTVNLFSGAVLDTKTGIKSKTKFKKHSLIVQDIRSDGNLELLVTSSDTKKRASVTLIRITKKTTLSVKARKEISNVSVDIKKTKIKGSTIELRDSKRKILRVLKVSKLYEFTNPK